MIGFRKILFALIAAFLLSSCSPTIYYLGEEYGRTRMVQVFYDEQHINEPYTVIGRLANDQKKQYEPEQIKKQMIRKAKKVGADALVFSDLTVDRLQHEREDRVIVKAKLIKFH
ncbi:MAG: hypothetical protein KGY60_02080 [Bacteroidales bacterium]|nr:hypothetical protein [Bacteroidales bacterium]